MADSPAFAWICRALEAETDLDRLESRGTVRIALKCAGLLAASVTPAQMRVVIERVLPAELEARGIACAGTLCARFVEGIGAVSGETRVDAPDEVFRRLGGG